MNNTPRIIYRQPVAMFATHDIVHVKVGEYVLTRVYNANILKTVLGSCVGLIGHKDWVGFMTYVKYHKEATDMLAQLRIDIQIECQCYLEDFHLTMTGWNRGYNLPYDSGEMIVNSVLDNLDRKPDTVMHLRQKVGNVVELHLQSGHAISTPIEE